MSYTKLQNNLSRKLDDCKVSKENKEILKNYFNNQKNNPSYEHHKYILDKNINILDKNKPNHIVINELKKRLPLSDKEQRCVFKKKNTNKNKYTSDKRLYEEDLDEEQYLEEKQEKQEKQEKLKMFIKNEELKKLKKNILVQKNECNKINKKAKKNTDFWIIISVILLIITVVILGLYIYKLQN